MMSSYEGGRKRMGQGNAPPPSAGQQQTKAPKYDYQRHIENEVRMGMAMAMEGKWGHHRGRGGRGGGGGGAMVRGNNSGYTFGHEGDFGAGGAYLELTPQQPQPPFEPFYGTAPMMGGGGGGYPRPPVPLRSLLPAENYDDYYEEAYNPQYGLAPGPQLPPPPPPPQRLMRGRGSHSRQGPVNANQRPVSQPPPKKKAVPIRSLLDVDFLPPKGHIPDRGRFAPAGFMGGRGGDHEPLFFSGPPRHFFEDPRGRGGGPRGYHPGYGGRGGTMPPPPPLFFGRPPAPQRLWQDKPYGRGRGGGDVYGSSDVPSASLKKVRPMFEDSAPTFSGQLLSCEDVGLMPYLNPLFYENGIKAEGTAASMAAAAMQKKPKYDPTGLRQRTLKNIVRNINHPKQTDDDRHVHDKHIEIFPKAAEMKCIMRLVEATEAGLKGVAKEFNKGSGDTNKLVGISRIGDLAKFLLLSKDCAVNLALLCKNPPTTKLLTAVQEMVSQRLQKAIQADQATVASKTEAGETNNGDKDDTHPDLIADSQVAATPGVQDSCQIDVHGFEEEAGFSVVMRLNESRDALVYAVNVTLTCLSMRENRSKGKDATKPEKKEAPAVDDGVLPLDKCRQALREVRRANWYTSTVPALPSCPETIRVIKELSRREHAWTCLSDWAIELLCEKALRTEPMPVLAPAKALRRVFEVIATGLFFPHGPGIMDPCERLPEDAAKELTLQQREDLTASAQTFLRMIEFDRIHELLCMEKLRPKEEILREMEEALKKKAELEEAEAAAKTITIGKEEEKAILGDA